MSNRLYVVRSAVGNERLVSANSQAQALRHVAASLFEVYVAKALDVAALMQAGVKPEVAGVEPAEEVAQ